MVNLAAPPGEGAGTGGFHRAAGQPDVRAGVVHEPTRPGGVALVALGFASIGAVEIGLSAIYAIGGVGAIGSLGAYNSTSVSGLNSTQLARYRYLTWALPTQTAFDVGFVVIGILLIATAYFLYSGMRRGRAWGPWLFLLSGLLYGATTLLFLGAPPGLVSSTDVGYYIDASAAEILVGVLLFLYFRTRGAAAYLRR